jgi:hypothetical protein
VPDGHITSDPRIMAVIRFDAKRLGYEGWADSPRIRAAPW